MWDQSAYNMEIFRPAYGNKLAAGVSMRVASLGANPNPDPNPNTNPDPNPNPNPNPNPYPNPNPDPDPNPNQVMNYLCFLNTKLLYK